MERRGAWDAYVERGGDANGNEKRGRLKLSNRGERVEGRR